MKLFDIIKHITPISVRGSQDVEITGICHDSRYFKSGDLFVAIRGHQYDGHLFIAEAADRGVSAVVVEDDRCVPLKYKGAVVKVKNTRSTKDILAAAFYEFPSEKLFIAGVTGTNGKTTSAYMIENLLKPEIPTAVMGTIDYHFNNEVLPSSHTTPDSIQIQKTFRHWVNEGAKAVSMEVSSHALTFHRADSVQFDAAVFTNLTRDHLDFHKSMEEYGAAKARLFHELLKNSRKKSRRAIVNRDDPHSHAMICEGVPTWVYGLELGDFRVKNFKLTLDYTEVDMITPVGEKSFYLPMIGLHNVYNSMGALGVGLHAGLGLETMAAKMSKLKSVRGRMERVESSSKVRVFIDYAHTDDALTNVLGFLSDLRNKVNSQNKIVTVFGCGGDRDKGKRPMMMKVAEKLSDRVYVTSDNPRTEKPEAIIDDVLQGATPTKVADGLIQVEVDRRVAIHKAIREAAPGDVVLIAGKGHEDYQIVGTKKIPFDDYKIAKENLEK